MASSSSPAHHDHHKDKTWSRDGFIVSTDPTLISISALSAAFNSPSMYWAQALPAPVMRDMINNSICFGLYTPTPVPHTEQPKEAGAELKSPIEVPASSRPTTPGAEAGPTQIGFARCITDHVTFLYLTDVYVLEEWQGQGLASWLIQCVQEVIDAMPYLRASLLITSNDGVKGIGMYEKRLKMTRIGNGARRGSIVERLGAMGSSPTGEEGRKQLIVMSAKGPGRPDY